MWVWCGCGVGVEGRSGGEEGRDGERGGKGWEERREGVGGEEGEDQECLKLDMPTNRNTTMLTLSIHQTYV